jgi:hypothetical protein
MNFESYLRESTLNRSAYALLREQIKRIPGDKYVAMAHGAILGIADTFDEACALVGEPCEYYLVFRADDEPNFGLAYDLNGGI